MGCASSNEAQPAKKPSAKQLALENQEKKARVNIIKEYFNEIAAFHPFTTDKVATHSTEKSLWVIIDGRVHDCTTWQHGHPGGAKSIQQQGGKDATEVFHQLHSKKTKEGVALKSAPTYIGAVWNFAPVAPHGIPELFNAAFEPPFVPSQGQLDLEQQEAEARLKLVLEYLHGVQDQHPFTRDKVATHSTEKSLWVIIDGRVHDCTTWQHDHPGGAKSIQQQGGKDATEVFHQLHSKKTKEGVALKSAPTYIGAVYHGVIPSAKTFADVPSNFKDTVEAPPTTEPSSKNEPHSTKAAVRQPAPQGHLDLYDFRPVKVGAVSKLTDDVVAVTLTFEDKHYVLPILPGGHVSIEVPVANADPVYRSYSPMTVKPGEAVFIVRRYPNGKGSNYLHARQAGDVIQVRGPIQPKYLFSQPPATSTLVLLAGGTGAAPLYSIARDAAKTRRVHLVLCFRHKDGGLLVEESRALAASVGGALSVAEVYSQETDERIAGMANTFNGRFKETTLRTIMGANASPTDEIVICGPEPFNTAGVSVAAALGFTPALVTVMD